MNIAKNMEVIFVVAIALASATGFATASASAVAPAAKVTRVVPQVVSHDATMHVVTISAKRMTAAEKAASAH